jgi:hypothetical protein
MPLIFSAWKYTPHLNLFWQGVIKVLLPIENPHTNFLAVFSVCIVAKSLQVRLPFQCLFHSPCNNVFHDLLVLFGLILYWCLDLQIGIIIYLQCNVDVFFIDWEVCILCGLKVNAQSLISILRDDAFFIW